MRRKALLFGIAVAALLLTSSWVFAVPAFTPGPDARDRMPGEIVIGFNPQATPEQIEAIVSSIGGRIMGKNNLPMTKIRRIKIASTDPSVMDEVMNSLKTNPAVKYAEPNKIKWIHGNMEASGGARVQAQSGDPLLYQQWGYYDIGANWVTAPTAGPVVAVIDTGVDYTHPDLAGRVIKGYDYVNADADPMDDYGHGTHVAGVIAAATNNLYGIAGISWNSKILAIKALSSQGWGTDFEIALAITAAANNASVKVINMSLGGSGYSLEEYDAVDYAVNTKKKLLVASAGNSGTDSPNYPAAFAGFPEFSGRVLAVAAHGTDHCKADFSSYGSWVSISAPGVGIFSTVPPSLGYMDFDSWDGTSMAAPHVSGAAALVWSKNPSLTNTQIASLLTGYTAADSLVRDGTCWPADPSNTFERLEVFHVLESAHFEECTKTGVIGYAMDAETGEPLLGAKVTTKLGASATGVDYVPYFGEVTDLFDETVFQGYGLFQVYMNTEAASGHTMQLQKSKYATYKLTEIETAPCDWTYVGNIPVPPNKDKYWLAVTWNDGYTGAAYDSVLYVPVYDDYIDPYYNVGNLNGLPWAKALWDSDDMYDQLYGNRRAYSEVIKIKKTVAGEYFYYIQDYGNGPGSTSWSESGIKAYIYRWDAATSTQKLVKTYTPPPGAGQYWDICTITGNTIADINSITD